MSLDAFLHGWLLPDDENDRMNEQAQSRSQDSGVFSDDESRDTVCLSPDREDLLSSGEESFSLTPEGRESLSRRMSSEETKHTCGELLGTPDGDDSAYGYQLSREPFDKIGLQRSSSLNNTMVNLWLRESEQAPVRSLTLPGHSPNKENATASRNAKSSRNSFKWRSRGGDADDNTFEGSSPREISHTVEPALRKQNYISLPPTKRKRNYVDHAFEVLETEQPRIKMKYSFRQKQNEGDNDTSDSIMWADVQPSKLVRLKCLLPGEAFKQKRLPVINTRMQRPTFSRPISLRTSKRHLERSSDAVTSQSSTSKVMTSQWSSTSGILTSHHSTFQLMTSPTNVSPEAKSSTSQEGKLFINLVAKVAPEGSRTVETKPIGLSTVAKQEPVFKIPEVLSLRKRRPMIIRQSQFLRGAKRKNSVDS